MANLLVYPLFLSVFFLKYFHFKVKIIPRQAIWLVDLLSLVVLCMVVIHLILKDRIPFARKYICLMFLFAISIAAGVFVNGPTPTSIIAGTRFYFKTMPFFLLPAIFSISDSQFKDQLKFLFILLLLQCPVALFQKFIQFSQLASITGDVVTGTLDTSSVLSIVLISSIAILFSFYLSRRISIRFFLLATAVLFLPTTINSTKGTLVLLPIALAVPLFLVHKVTIMQKKKLLFRLAALGTVLILIFVTVEDHFMKKKGGFSVVDLFTDADLMDQYYFHSRNKKSYLNRGDALELAYDTLSKDIGTFIFGTGMGKTVQSYLVEKEDKEKIGANSIAVTNIMWDLGFSGLIAYGIFFIFIFKDVLFVRKFGGVVGVFATGWSGVVLIVGISFLYKNILQMDIICYLFWYFSGIIAITAVRLKAMRVAFCPDATKISNSFSYPDYSSRTMVR